MALHRLKQSSTKKIICMTVAAMAVAVLIAVCWPTPSASLTPPVWHPVAPKTLPLMPTLLPTYAQTGPDVATEPLRPMAPPVDTFPYSVRSGDTLSAIALYCESDVTALAALNGLTNPDWLSIGQQLILPCEV